MAIIEAPLPEMGADEFELQTLNRVQIRERAAYFIKRLMSFMPLDAPDYMSDHFYPEHYDDGEI